MDLVYKFNTEDDYPVPAEGKLCEMKNYRYTFWNSQLDSLPQYMCRKSIDLLMLSLAVYGADRYLLRKEAVDGWKRNIHIHLPVLDLESMDGKKELIKNILDFLSGDNWELSFRQRKHTDEEKTYRDKIENGKKDKINANRICMFSGGLDSFIGAIDLLQENVEEIIFVSHYGGGKGVREYQDLLRKKFIKEYEMSDNNFFSFFAAPPGGIEDTMRTRSFMFFSHAIALASCFEGDIDLIVPENGFISLNVPLTYSRMGTSSTRTTHPYYMGLLQQLLNEMGLKIHIKNPYQFKTKGEMIVECKNQDFLKKNIAQTMSCSHPDVGRMRGESDTQHCGTCLPCIIRRAAIKKAGFDDSTEYYDPNFTSGDTARTNLNSYLLGLQKYDEKNAFLTIQTSGPLVDNIERYESIYKRGMDELKSLLEEYNGNP
ncbi:7-cyano-7-deazaguanine synthase [Salipaludibacillus sp. LMS25]|jgi:7-cyano-7-deazaguanine synthase in queuosine biosynthesis|uniref:Qat anti-phage system QueC-like protein QatC n=1 Tax=Salipaludibacillus sp. LMS25 TaxID=2924031 RepID=UPI0020D0D0C0|nr:Qat anti-phage system QueC-like protein QatC [Salipaludibacillus sp. LMS25]UTR14913.1 7-cyano-7-deazaguanine synthase [Salipaludibacillus sp. LMS25]